MVKAMLKASFFLVALAAHASGYAITSPLGVMGRVGSRRMTCRNLMAMGAHHGAGGGGAKGGEEAAAATAVGGGEERWSLQRRDIFKVALAAALAAPLGAAADGAATIAPPPGEIYTDPEGEVGEPQRIANSHSQTPEEASCAPFQEPRSRNALSAAQYL